MTSVDRQRCAECEERRAPTSPAGRAAVQARPRPSHRTSAGRSGRPGRWWRAICRTLAAGLSLATTVGCGIRTTSVPVDAGPAPSRDSCAAPARTTPTSTDEALLTSYVYLVCGSRALAVHRAVPLPENADPDDRLAVARTLLRALQQLPTDAETDAGFTTDVPHRLRVSGPRADDPSTALRLSEEPTELPAFALAQIVCTYASTPAAAEPDRTVVLGGPRPDRQRPYLRYECTSTLRTHPHAAQTAGRPL